MVASAFWTLIAAVEGAPQGSNARTRYGHNECNTFAFSHQRLIHQTSCYAMTLQLPNGKGCLEDEDCKSDRCSKWLKCEDKVRTENCCSVESSHLGKTNVVDVVIIP